MSNAQGAKNIIIITTTKVLKNFLNLFFSICIDAFKNLKGKSLLL